MSLVIRSVLAKDSTTAVSEGMTYYYWKGSIVGEVQKYVSSLASRHKKGFER